MQNFMLEQGFNYLIDKTNVDLSALTGKTFYFEISDLDVGFHLLCVNERIFVTREQQQVEDVNIRVESRVFLELLQGADLSKLLKADKIIINGDIKTTQLLIEVLSAINLDLEAILASYTGANIAGKVSKLARKIHPQNLAKSADFIQDQLTKFIINPRKYE